jgi:hypothetical protein
MLKLPSFFQRSIAPSLRKPFVESSCRKIRTTNRRNSYWSESVPLGTAKKSLGAHVKSLELLLETVTVLSLPCCSAADYLQHPLPIHWPFRWRLAPSPPSGNACQAVTNLGVEQNEVPIYAYQPALQ